MKKKLSDRQRFILSFICQYREDYDFAPTIREIKGELERAGLTRTESGTTSNSVVHYNLKALEERGYIKRNFNRARSLVILKDLKGKVYINT